MDCDHACVLAYHRTFGGTLVEPDLKVELDEEGCLPLLRVIESDVLEFGWIHLAPSWKLGFLLHDNLKPYEVTQDEDGYLVYDTSKEDHFGRVYHKQRAQWYADKLAQSTGRLADPVVKQAAAEQLAMWEEAMKPGEGGIHLQRLLAMASYRGTDIRAYVCLEGDPDQCHHMSGRP